ncbi:MAG: AbrB/MazE/SpoVT family DNA-binding domain-containing protein [Clostridiales bacterium]|nr:AbrB/MazE/SpoVT family DNA-binding domain-containing protein [Clostridiales bacterium]
MKATGIVRRIDDLGRVVIPKEIRRTMRIREGDPLEIYTDRDGEVIFKKYSLMGGMSECAVQLCESLYKTTGCPTLITDRDAVIAVSGIPRREALEKHISAPLESIMEGRSIYQYREGSNRLPVVENSDSLQVATAAPILTGGDVMGCVVFAAQDGAAPGGETEFKLAQTASGFLGRHMES